MHRIKLVQRSTVITQIDIMGRSEEEETFMYGMDILSENI